MVQNQYLPMGYPQPAYFPQPYFQQPPTEPQKTTSTVVPGAVVWADREEAESYEAPVGVPVALFINGAKECHIKSHDDKGKPTTLVLDYTERVNDDSPYATKAQIAAVRQDIASLAEIVRKISEGQEDVSNVKPV